MDLNVVKDFICACGFPVCMCVFMIWFLYKYVVPCLQETIKTNKELSQSLLLMNERMKNVEDDVDDIKTDIISIKNKVGV